MDVEFCKELHSQEKSHQSIGHQSQHSQRTDDVDSVDDDNKHLSNAFEALKVISSTLAYLMNLQKKKDIPTMKNI